MLKTVRPVDTEALDRLEDKVKLLVALIGRMRTEQARMADEHQKMSKELDAVIASKDKLMEAVWDLTGDGNPATSDGIFVFTGIVLKITGPALPIAFALACKNRFAASFVGTHAQRSVVLAGG